MSQHDIQSFDFDDVDHLMRNADLRNQLEPYFDEAICRVNVEAFSTAKENEFLASMLAWERAPVLPIAEWFDPPLSLPLPDTFSDDAVGNGDLHTLLWDTIYRLFEKRIVLDFTDHLTDRELYQLIFRDILPSEEKNLDSTESYLHWDCVDASRHPHIWLCYYATEEEREEWVREHNELAPGKKTPPHCRQLPRRPL